MSAFFRDTRVWMFAPVIDVTLLFLLPWALLCSCSQEPQTEGKFVTVIVRARTPDGVVLSEVEVSASSESLVRTTTSLVPESVRTDDEGNARLMLPRGVRSWMLNASCPHLYEGKTLNRRLSVSMLRSSEELSFDLICEKSFHEMTIAILSKECVSAEVFVDGMSRGFMDEGAFHLVEKRKYVPNVVVSVESGRSDCVFKNSTQTIEMSTEDRSIWARFEGRRKRKWRRSNRRVHRPVKSSRPYKL